MHSLPTASVMAETWMSRMMVTHWLKVVSTAFPYSLPSPLPAARPAPAFPYPLAQPLTRLALQFQLVHQLADGAGGLVEGGLLLSGELDLDDLLDAAPAELHGHANIEPADAVLTVQVGRAGQDLLLVLQDGLDHLHRGRRGGVVRPARLGQGHDLRAAVGGAGDERLDPVRGQQVRDRDARHRGVARQRTQ